MTLPAELGKYTTTHVVGVVCKEQSPADMQTKLRAMKFKITTDCGRTVRLVSVFKDFEYGQGDCLYVTVWEEI